MENQVENRAMFNIPYGLYLLSVSGEKGDNACIINTAMQITDSPKRISIAVNKANYTHDLILKSGEFNVSVLSKDAPFSLFERFGFVSGAEANKFYSEDGFKRSANGLLYEAKFSNAFMSGRVIKAEDMGTHTVFFAEITEAKVISDIPSLTYAYYFQNIKPKPKKEETKKGFVCKICGYVYEGDSLPEDFICPLCKHGAADFEPIN